MASVKRSWATEPVVNPKLNWLASYVPTFRPRGSLGLFVSQGTAAFRDVTLEPLPPPPQE